MSDRMETYLRQRQLARLFFVVALAGACELEIARADGDAAEGWPAVFDELHILAREAPRLAAQSTALLLLCEAPRAALEQLRRFQRRWLSVYPRTLRPWTPFQEPAREGQQETTP